MTAADSRRRARTFLRQKQLLSPAETDQALHVAAAVLDEAMRRLETAVAGRDGKTCAEAAHGLKGNLLNLGLPDLAGVAQVIQEKAQAGDFEVVTTAIAHLTAALAPLRG
jgi:HPt (histidine-containing phosphotransfer) domain-containing protein